MALLVIDELQTEHRPFVKIISAGTLVAVHTRYEGTAASEPHLVPSFGLGDAFMTATHLRDMTRADLWRNGRAVGPISSRQGELQLFDLRQNWRGSLYPPFETVNIRISVQMLEEAVGAAGPMPFDPHAIATGRIDPVMLNLSQALLPAFLRPNELTLLFAERLMLTAAAHLMAEYSQHGSPLTKPKEGLALWQQRRAIDAMMDRLGTDVSLAEIAAECGLSMGHFSKAFRLSFGMPPHRWVLRERVRRAADMMDASDIPLKEIAVACGFVDQSHLSRVFRTVMGLPPGSWRRHQARDLRR